MNLTHAFVQYALATGALELTPGGRTLKSGRVSPYFFNSGLFTTGRALSFLTLAYANAITKADENGALRPEVIYGPSYKGIPLSVGTAIRLSEREEYQSIGWCFNRKEAKAHGEGGILVGAKLTRRRTIIIDDVITNGDSKREAVDIIEQHEGIPIACVIAFDRMETMSDDNLSSAADVFSDESGLPVFASASLIDLIQVLQVDPTIPKGPETLPLIYEYVKRYGSSELRSNI